MGDLIIRRDAINIANDLIISVSGYEQHNHAVNSYSAELMKLPSAESVKAYTKADYIMALHKEYGCTLTMAEEAHNKALEYLRSKARMKG